MTAEDKRIAKVAELSSKTFDKHVITQDLNQGVFRSWHCARPQASAYWFRVTTWPGHFAITGDVGDFVWCREHDMLPWVRSAIGSVSYFAEKVVAGDTKEYDATVFAEKISGMLSPTSYGDGENDTIQKFLETTDFTDQHGASQAYYDSDLYQGDFPSTQNYCHDFLWCREALKWWLTKVEP